MGRGSGDQVFNNHSGRHVFLVPTPVRGGDPNDDDETTGDGTVGVGENAPSRITGSYVPAHRRRADARRAAGSLGQPGGDAPFWLAVLIAVAGAALIWSSAARGRRPQ